VSKNLENLGLCSTCRNASDCTFHGDSSKPMMHCEEFECEEPCQTDVFVGEKPSQSEMLVAKGRESDLSMGLCSDCEGREDCCFPNVDGGVWHCEEYR
jgi:hypothetical protein